MAKVPFKGVLFELGGVTYVIPPIAFGKLRDLRSQVANIQNVGGFPTDEQLDAALDIFMAAFERNYPSMTREQLAGLLDLGAMQELIPIVMGVSGLVKVSEVPEGEAQPVVVSTP